MVPNPAGERVGRHQVDDRLAVWPDRRQRLEAAVAPGPSGRQDDERSDPSVGRSSLMWSSGRRRWPMSCLRRTRSAGRCRRRGRGRAPWRRGRARGMEAEDVLPYRSMTTAVRSSGMPSRWQAAWMMRTLAWCGTNKEMSSGPSPASAMACSADSTTTRTARRKTSLPSMKSVAPCSHLSRCRNEPSEFRFQLSRLPAPSVRLDHHRRPPRRRR